MEALSPTQIESLLADRLKRHEDRLREHRAALAGQKMWLERNKSGASASGGGLCGSGEGGTQQHQQVENSGGGGGGGGAGGNRGHHDQMSDDRYATAFHPSQVLPSSSVASSSMPSPSSQHLPSPPKETTGGGGSRSGGDGEGSVDPHQQQPQPHGSNLDAGSLSRRGQQHHQQSRTPTSSQQPQPTSSFSSSSRPPARATSPRTGSVKSQQNRRAGSRSQSASRIDQQHQEHRSAMLAAAMQDRNDRVSKMMLKFGPETGDAVGADILSGGSIMDVAAAESAACTFKPSISADSRVLAKKLRSACGAQGKDVVSSMEAIHSRAKEQKWLRMQQIHEEQTRPYHLQRRTTTPRGGAAAAGGGAHRTPARSGGGNNAAATPRAGGGATTPRALHNHSIASSSGISQPGHSAAAAAAAHDRLYQQSTKHVKEERFRQIVSDATQENTFSPAITQRARSLRRHPGHSVGGDLHALSLMKSDRDALAAQLREEMEHATARQQGQPTIDTVSASIATSLAESSYERLTKPAQHNRQRRHQSGTPSSRGSSASGASSSSAQEHTFAPEINRRSEILAHTSSTQHSPNTLRQRRDEKLRHLREEVDQKRYEECTFAPTINSSSASGSGGNGENKQQQQQQQRSGDFFSRNEAWMKRRDKNIAEMRQQKVATEMEECVFQPQQTNLGHGFGYSQHENHHHHHNSPPAIYGGSDQKAWGVEHHLDRMQAARIIDQDRRERAASGLPYSEHNLQHQDYQQHQQQSSSAYRSSSFQQNHQNQPASSSSWTFRDPTDQDLGTFASQRAVAGEQQNSVLHRAQEALQRAVAVSADSGQH